MGNRMAVMSLMPVISFVLAVVPFGHPQPDVPAGVEAVEQHLAAKTVRSLRINPRSVRAGNGISCVAVPSVSHNPTCPLALFAAEKDIVAKDCDVGGFSPRPVVAAPGAGQLICGRAVPCPQPGQAARMRH